MKNPTDPLPTSSEPLQPGETAATKVWRYKHSNAALGNVKACNTIFKYDYQIQEVLDWQQISKPKRNTNATSQAQYKIQLQPVTIEKWALPLFQSTGLRAAKTEPFPRSQNVEDCCQICWSPVSQEHPNREENYDDMPQCDTCQRTYHWNCLTDLNACSHTARQGAENSEDWHCPACTDQTQAENDTRKSYAEEKEIIKVIWQPTWEAAELLLANPDFKA